MMEWVLIVTIFLNNGDTMRKTDIFFKTEAACFARKIEEDVLQLRGDLDWLRDNAPLTQVSRIERKCVRWELKLRRLGLI